MNTTHKPKKIITLSTLVLACLVLVAASLISSFSSDSAYSAAVKGFQPGNIMSDSVFTNKNSMNASQIQSFLNSKVPYCDTQGSKSSEYGGGTRKQYAAKKGVKPPFTCLRDYSQGGKSAARIIYDAAQEFSINPQVLIVLLQKEQGLVTDEWPWPVQYRAATGYGCPDTAACDSEYYGFTNQVRWSARMFRAIMNDSPTWYTPYKLGNNRIYWHPDLSRCGSSTVNIQNRTTVALYSYTPYRPNTAALNAGYGTGNSCSSYGNRNFYQYFKDWFGGTHDKWGFGPLKNPRQLRLKGSLKKVNPSTGEGVGTTLPRGMEIYFATRITKNGELYLRTQHDTNKQLNRGVKYTDLESTIGINPMLNARSLRLTKSVAKTNFRTGKSDGVILAKGRDIYFTDRYTYNGELYLRTASDSSKWLERGIKYSDLQNSLGIKPMLNARSLRLTKSIAKTNFRTGKSDGVVLSKNMNIYFTERYTYKGKLYLRTAVDSNKLLERGIRYSDLK